MIGLHLIPGASRLKAGLTKTRNHLGRLLGRPVLDEDWFEEMESALIVADVGGRVSHELVTTLRASLKKEPIDPTRIEEGLRERLVQIVEARLAPLVPRLNETAPHVPRVMMVVGVNGAGKTTSIGKIAHWATSSGQKVLLAAGDTFRAAAREQLLTWGKRNGVEVISQVDGDPAAVGFDAVKAGIARGAELVVVDTAGRLPTQLHLMEELKKVKRVLAKALEGAPHDVWLVVDGGTGQNAIAQVKAFDDALGLTGLVVTKLDGTAKGGVLLALAAERPIPVHFIGVGEAMEDLQPFTPASFAHALI
ncbi:MAG: signal recognition particle-docking protein FtsY [Betaproteobacteria bacterium]|nr:signal recognition particle-docking protein FtsY [Betaproteobacteria bacterium]NBT75039.1 signal recognition particle-docking protein FtsY [Betaproteobacteria bacterium]NBY13321.1 signal recognition particle-docking protein FtsY [Betaproteobacteria bacterium]NCA16950.1 signal recognition particle-docking protein FtsY [Betaproteobacteria bacterium]